MLASQAFARDQESRQLPRTRSSKATSIWTRILISLSWNSSECLYERGLPFSFCTGSHKSGVGSWPEQRQTTPVVLREKNRYEFLPSPVCSFRGPFNTSSSRKVARQTCMQMGPVSEFTMSRVIGSLTPPVLWVNKVRRSSGRSRERGRMGI